MLSMSFSKNFKNLLLIITTLTLVASVIYTTKSSGNEENITLLYPSKNYEYYPESFGIPDIVDQGLNQNEYAAGKKLIDALVDSPDIYLVMTYNAESKAYEVYGKNGMVKFIRTLKDTGFEYKIVEQVGINPIGVQDPYYPEISYPDVNETSYPYAYERITAFFDDERAPDIAVDVSAKYGGSGELKASHGSLDVTQSRGPLIISGAGIKTLGKIPVGSKYINIAPTIMKLLGAPKIIGRTLNGQLSSNVYLKWQDGEPLEGYLDGNAERVIIILLDGANNQEFVSLFDQSALPNFKRLVDRGIIFEYGAITNFPSVTWPSHHTIGTGAYSGHHGIFGNEYYERSEKRKMYPLSSENKIETVQYWLTDNNYIREDVETLCEGIHRAFPGSFTATVNEPTGRGCDHDTLTLNVDWNLLYNPDFLREFIKDIDYISWKNIDIDVKSILEDPEKLTIDPYLQASVIDHLSISQVVALLGAENNPVPKLIYMENIGTDEVGHYKGAHSEAVRDYYKDTDKRLGRLIGKLEEENLLDSTSLFVVADHGMEDFGPEPYQYYSKAKNTNVKYVLAQGVFFYLQTMNVSYELKMEDGVRELRFYVRDDDTGKGIAQANITIDFNGYVVTFQTDNNGVGKYAIPRISGTFNFKITHEEFTEYTSQITVVLSVESLTVAAGNFGMPVLVAVVVSRYGRQLKTLL